MFLFSVFIKVKWRTLSSHFFHSKGSFLLFSNLDWWESWLLELIMIHWGGNIILIVEIAVMIWNGCETGIAFQKGPKTIRKYYRNRQQILKLTRRIETDSMYRNQQHLQTKNDIRQHRLKLTALTKTDIID